MFFHIDKEFGTFDYFHSTPNRLTDNLISIQLPILIHKNFIKVCCLYLPRRQSKINQFKLSFYFLYVMDLNVMKWNES